MARVLVGLVALLATAPRQATFLGKAIRLPAGCELKQEKPDNANVDCREAGVTMSWLKVDRPLASKALDDLTERISAKKTVLKKETPPCSILGLPATCRRLVFETTSGAVVSHFGVTEHQGSMAFVFCNFAQGPVGLPAPCDQLFGPVK